MARQHVVLIIASSRRRWSSVLLALICGWLAAGCESHGSEPSPVADLAHRLGAIELVSAQGREPAILTDTVTDPGQVRQIVGWIAQMHPVPPGAYSCPMTAGVEPTVSLIFRASARGAVLARASETDPGYGSGPCNPLTVEIPGHKSVALVAGRFLEHLQRLVHVDFGFGFGQITGRVDRGGGPSGTRRIARPRPAANRESYMVNAYLADPTAFAGYGNGPLLGTSISRTGLFSIKIAPGAYLLVVAPWGSRPTCPRTLVRVRVAHTTHVNLPVDCHAP